MPAPSKPCRLVLGRVPYLFGYAYFDILSTPAVQITDRESDEGSGTGASCSLNDWASVAMQPAGAAEKDNSVCVTHLSYILAHVVRGGQRIRSPSTPLSEYVKPLTYPANCLHNCLLKLRFPAAAAFSKRLDYSHYFFLTFTLLSTNVSLCFEKFSLATYNSLWNTHAMIIGDRLRAMREEKKLSQGDIEKRTGLLRCYISRVENGHTVPAIETLEKLARALECPLYQLFYDGEEPPQLPNLPKRKSSDDIAWGSAGKDARYLNKLRRLLSKADDEDRKLILYMAQKVANR